MQEDKKNLVKRLEELNWYVCTTLPRGEKIADRGLRKLRIEHYLPTINKTRQWSDRKKVMEFPLFNGYIFILENIGASRIRKRVLQAPKIAYFVQKDGIPVIVPDSVIRSLMILTSQWNEQFELENEDINSQLKEGDPIRIINGPLRGVAGTLIRKKNFPRIVVFVEAIGQGVSLEVDLHTVEKMNELNS
jgi:transcription antitermination factor NusG